MSSLYFLLIFSYLFSVVVKQVCMHVNIVQFSDLMNIDSLPIYVKF